MKPHTQDQQAGSYRPCHSNSLCRSDGLRVVDDGPLYGLRLVAMRRFIRGELILRLQGRPAAQSFRSIQVGVCSHLEGYPFSFLNHSCRPTAIVLTPQAEFRAWEELKIGEEVTFFYPSTEWEMVRPFVCLCGAPGCIRYVAGAKYLSADLLGHYFISPHVRTLVATALAQVAAAATDPPESEATPTVDLAPTTPVSRSGRLFPAQGK